MVDPIHMAISTQTLYRDLSICGGYVIVSFI
jgi:hypothetical protein